jgi:hypothetical protein
MAGWRGRAGKVARDPARQLDAGVQAEFGEDVRHVRLDRRHRDEQSRGDGRVRQPIGHQPGDLQLARAQLVGVVRRRSRRAMLAGADRPLAHVVMDIPLRKHWHEARALRIAQRPRRATAPLALAVHRIPPPLPSPPGSWPCHFGDTPSGKWRSFLRAVLRASRLLPVLPGPVNVITRTLDNSRRTSLSSGPRPTKLVSSTRRFSPVGWVTAVVMTQPNLTGRTTPRCPSGSSVPVPKRPRTLRLPKGLLPPARYVDADPEVLNATPPRRAGHRAHPPDVPRPGPTAATGPGRFTAPS